MQSDSFHMLLLSYLQNNSFTLSSTGDVQNWYYMGKPETADSGYKSTVDLWVPCKATSVC